MYLTSDTTNLRVRSSLFRQRGEHVLASRRSVVKSWKHALQCFVLVTLAPPLFVKSLFIYIFQTSLLLAYAYIIPGKRDRFKIET